MSSPEDLPVDDPEHWCGYCEYNRYDTETCSYCNGAGCDECDGHGFKGYSW